MKPCSSSSSFRSHLVPMSRRDPARRREHHSAQASHRASQASFSSWGCGADNHVDSNVLRQRRGRNHAETECAKEPSSPQASADERGEGGEDQPPTRTREEDACAKGFRLRARRQRSGNRVVGDPMAGPAFVRISHSGTPSDACRRRTRLHCGCASRVRSRFGSSNPEVPSTVTS